MGHTNNAYGIALKLIIIKYIDMGLPECYAGRGAENVLTSESSLNLVKKFPLTVLYIHC